MNVTKIKRKSELTTAQVCLTILSKYGTIIALTLMIIGFSMVRPAQFPTIKNALVILKAGAEVSIVAIGLTVVMVLLDFDLSIGFLASLAGILTTGLMSYQQLPWPLAVAIGLLVGSAAGFINGKIVTGLGVSSIITTLATGSIFVGLTFWYGRGSAVFSGIPKEFVGLARATPFGIPSNVILMAVFAFLIWVFLTHTEKGRHMYAIGGSPEAARLSGINVERTRVLAFTITGFASALAGIALAARLSQGHPQGGDAFLLDSFTACFLGAATLRNGEFNVPGTVIAVIIISVMVNGLTMVGAEFFLQNIIKGSLLVAAVALSGVGRRILG
jgi:ribose transport system permease protein